MVSLQELTCAVLPALLWLMKAGFADRYGIHTARLTLATPAYLD